MYYVSNLIKLFSVNTHSQIFNMWWRIPFFITELVLKHWPSLWTWWWNLRQSVCRMGSQGHCWLQWKVWRIWLAYIYHSQTYFSSLPHNLPQTFTKIMTHITVYNVCVCLTGDSGKTCSRVECPPLYPASCEGVTPPGGCCPICGRSPGSPIHPSSRVLVLYLVLYQ